MAERGIDVVTMREICAAADQRNASAVNYHFGGPDGLRSALLARHEEPIDRRRHELLDAVDPARPDLVGLSRALVLPVAERLATASGCRYVAIGAQIMHRSGPDIMRTIDPTNASALDRWRLLIEPLLSAEAVEEHARFTASQLTYIELANRVRREGSGLDVAAAGERVVALVHAVLSAPASL